MTRIAMWSGPRNLSTAMMYSFGARADCAVWDEPYYAAYLADTGLDHPLDDAVLAAWPTDPAAIAALCAGPARSGKQVFYQKHMTHHMLPHFDRGWMAQVHNAFLIRHPARVIASYHAKRERPVLADLGFEQQLELFHQAKALAGHAPVLDSADIRARPKDMLSKLCDAVGMAFDPAMLSWPAGGHPDDGPWAPHWYGAVWKSTGFAGAEGPLPELPEDLQPLLDAALPFYEELAQHKL